MRPSKQVYSPKLMNQAITEARRVIPASSYGYIYNSIDEASIKTGEYMLCRLRFNHAQAPLNLN